MAILEWSTEANKRTNGDEQANKRRRTSQQTEADEATNGGGRANKRRRTSEQTEANKRALSQPSQFTLFPAEVHLLAKLLKHTVF